MTLTAAVIGCGRIGAGFAAASARVGVASHAAAYAATAGVQLVGLSDPSAPARGEAAARFGVPAWADHREMLAAVRPALVSVASPDATHAQVLAEVLDAPGVRGVLAEKPLAATPAEAAALVAQARARGVVLAVNYGRRYSAPMQALAARLRGGEFGRLRALTGHYTKGVAHNGSHWFDWARLLAGEIARVQAFDDGMPAFEGDPTPSLRLEFAGGCGGWLQALSFEDYAPFELDLLTERARLRFGESGHVVEISATGASPDYPGYRQLLPLERQDGLLTDVLLHAVADLAAAVAGGRPPLCSGADGLAALRVAAAAVDSLDRGAAVEVEGD
ncbi:Gfo/Idh/MocA family protein [Chitinimonas koreensis]|uniref:Gfo/Idh/MocA family protein n=1 Tax=Chitinimonas koreensis TaxID=356302 RepID=UPI00040F1E55|nr:Gfo/Idh/MocA family oxidoreductase [Chitinimonas koreensis]QNM98496.1 Gfo/Idh/MocA family oxidoreductase [Chitinimonas koreensis]